MSCAGRHHLAKSSEATRDYTDTNWDGELDDPEKQRVAVVDSDCGHGVLRVYNITPSSTGAPESADEFFQVSVPSKFHKLIWFLRGDVIVHDGSDLVRKVSDEQLRRLAKENPESVFAAGYHIHNLRQEKREEAPADILDKNPNLRAVNSRRVATGFTSSDDDDDDDGEVEQEEEEEGDASK